MDNYEEEKAFALQLSKESARLLASLHMKLTSISQAEMQTHGFIEPILDDTIDPGDKEQMVSHLLTCITRVPEYSAYMDWYRENRQAFSRMHQFFGTVPEEQFEDAMLVVQQATTEILVEQLLSQLKAQGFITDKR